MPGNSGSNLDMDKRFLFESLEHEDVNRVKTETNNYLVWSNQHFQFTWISYFLSYACSFKKSTSCPSIHKIELSYMTNA